MTWLQKPAITLQNNDLEDQNIITLALSKCIILAPSYYNSYYTNLVV